MCNLISPTRTLGLAILRNAQFTQIGQDEGAGAKGLSEPHHSRPVSDRLGRRCQYVICVLKKKLVPGRSSGPTPNRLPDTGSRCSR